MDRMYNTITIWVIIVMLIGYFNQKDIESYNIAVHKISIYLYDRFIQGKEVMLDFSSTTISYNHYEEFMEYLNQEKKEQKNQEIMEVQSE